VDLAHAQHSGDLGTLVPAARLGARRVPVVLSKRVGSYIAKRDPWHGWLYARVARVLAVSEVIRRNVSDTTPVPPGRVRTLHDAIDLGRFVPGSADRRAVRVSLGLGQDEVGIGFVGRFSPGKGHEELLKAAAALKPRHPRARFVVVGEASRGEEAYEASVRALAHQLGLEDTVTFTGFRRDVPAVMEAFDVFAFPSHAEAFGVVAIEAMAMARPVVATGSDGILDIVVDGETGLLFPRADAGALAGALARLIEDPALRERLGRAGRARVERDFERERQTERLEGHYREVLAAPAGAARAAG
jgi:glycosyltransferase involved in cell wall biosynthesis